MTDIVIVHGDITTMQVDAIVNAANSSLLGGGGVDGAIHRKGGKAILAECQQIRAKQGGCKTGEAVITQAGQLSAKYVIHTVGPIWHADTEIDKQQQLLAQCYRNSLRLAEQYHCQSIAFPNISTGVYHFPKDQAAKIVATTLAEEIQQLKSIQTIYLVCFDVENYQLYQTLFAPD